ncbi:MAG: recombinase family protein [Enhydrobacter sp.]|nr:MAG: recombinase family protein [Enhydrobacter sp.]
MSKRVALYLRVSTDHQTTDNQERELRQVAERAGWQIVEVYKDRGISGAKDRVQRPAFDRMCSDAARRKFDVIASWSIDRLGRSLQGLVAFLSDIHGLGVDLYLHQQGIDTTTPSGKAMFQMMGVFAEFERAMIRERVKAGLERAVAQGRKLGRPRLDSDKERAIRAALRKGGVGVRKIAERVGVGTSAVQRIKAELAAA